MSSQDHFLLSSALENGEKQENLKLNELVQNLDNENKELHEKLFQKDIELGDKSNEIRHLNNKISFMENELSARFADYEQRFHSLSATSMNATSLELKIRELNEKIAEMAKDSQDSYSIIIKKNEDNNALLSEISDLNTRIARQSSFINELELQVQSLEFEKESQLSQIISLDREREALLRANSNYKENIERLLFENERVQGAYVKNEEYLKTLHEELGQKNLTLVEFEEMVKGAQERIENLQEEQGRMTLEFAVNNLESEQKNREEIDKMKEIVATTEVVENLNVLLSEKIEENRQLNEIIEDLSLQLAAKEEALLKKSTINSKLQVGLEKLLSHVDSQNIIISNQNSKISTLNDSYKFSSLIFNGIKDFAAFLSTESQRAFDFDLRKENPDGIFSDFRVIFKDLSANCDILKEKLMTMIIINDNFVKILEGQLFSNKDVEVEEKIRYEGVIEDLKKKIYLMLRENGKLNTALEKADKNTRIFKSWTDSRDIVETMGLKNELMTAKRNIVKLLNKNKELLEAFKGKNLHSSREKDNNEGKFVFQVNSLKKQNEILKEMNKNRGLVIENLLKKLKNQRI